jgi:hypothetical protein
MASYRLLNVLVCLALVSPDIEDGNFTVAESVAE